MHDEYHERDKADVTFSPTGMQGKVRLDDEGWHNLPSAEALRKASKDARSGWKRYSPELRQCAVVFAQNIIQVAEKSTSEKKTLYQECTSKRDAQLLIELMGKTGSWPADAFYISGQCDPRLRCDCQIGEMCNYEVSCVPFWRKGWKSKLPVQ